jgi:hypothetical protein
MSNFYQRWCINHPVKTFFITWFIACAILLPLIWWGVRSKTTTTTTAIVEPKCVDSMNIIRAPGLGIADSHHTKAECPKDSVPIVVQTGDPNLIYFSCHCK